MYLQQHMVQLLYYLTYPSSLSVIVVGSVVVAGSVVAVPLNH